MTNAKDRFQSGTLFQSTPRQKAEAQRTADRKKNRKLDVAAIMRQAGLQDTTIERRTGEPLSGIDITGPYETEFGKRSRKRAESNAKLPVADQPTNIRMANGGSTSGKVQTSADTARKLATEMGGMKDGGKPKSGLAVMIAIGAPMKGMKKPVKKMDGGVPQIKSSDLMAKGGGMKPVKKAQGGAGKVRKGMMTPEGNIIHAMNKIRGK